MIPPGLPGALEAAAARDVTWQFVERGGTRTASTRELHGDARRWARRLQQLGVGEGDIVVLAGRTSYRLAVAIQAVWLAGACVTIMPLPAPRHGAESFAPALASRISHSGAALLLADDEIAPLLPPPAAGCPAVTLAELERQAPAAEIGRPVAGRLAILQYTSGSTAEPKAVPVTADALIGNVTGIAQSIGIGDDDALVSWLPLYHDMGIVGTYCLPALLGIRLLLADTALFSRSPASWFSWLSDFRGTLSAAPSFAYGIAARTLAATSGRLDLASCRSLINGAEPIAPGPARGFVTAAARHRLPPSACRAAYGMAETTLAVCLSGRHEPIRFDLVDADALEREGVAQPGGSARSVELAIVGRPIPGMEVRVGDPAAGQHPPGVVGEICVAGRSVLAGYWRGDGDGAAFSGRWYRTGDLGYHTPGGELVICGRIKDLIIIAGRNIHPQEVEWAVSGLPGVLSGGVAAFSVPHGAAEGIGVVVEVRQVNAGPGALRDQVARAVHEAVGTRPAIVALARPQAIPRTTSGKLQRRLCRDRLLAGELELAGT